MLRSIEERYKTICQQASNYSVLSVGLSCFKIRQCSLPTITPGDGTSQKKPRTVTVENKTFNVFTLCTDDFQVEPKSIKFLLEHGFDFNKQFGKGVNYHKGNDKVNFEFKHLLLFM